MGAYWTLEPDFTPCTGLDQLGKALKRLGTFKNPHLGPKITKIGPEEVKISLGRYFDDNRVKWGGLAKMAFLH